MTYLHHSKTRQVTPLPPKLAPLPPSDARTKARSIQRRVVLPYLEAAAKAGLPADVRIEKGLERIYINGKPYRIGDVTRMRRELEARVK